MKALIDEVKVALRSVRTWRLGRGFVRPPAAWCSDLTAAGLLVLLRWAVHETHGWTGVNGLTLRVYYGLDVAPPRSERDTGRVVAAQIQANRPFSIASVRRKLRAGENALSAVLPRSLPRGRVEITAEADPVATLINALPSPPWGLFERRLAHGLLALSLPVARKSSRSHASRATHSREVRTALANIDVATVITAMTEQLWPPAIGRQLTETNSTPGSSTDAALRGGPLHESYTGLLELTRRALSEDGIMASYWLQKIREMRTQSDVLGNKTELSQQNTVEYWYRGQLAFDYQDLAALQREASGPRLRSLPPLGRADGFHTSSIHAAMIYEARILTSHGRFAEAHARVEQRRRELLRPTHIREPDADTTYRARMKSKLMANQTELEILVTQLERAQKEPQASLRHLFRQAMALADSILVDAEEMTNEFGYSHFAAIAVRLHLAMADRATSKRKRDQMTAAAVDILQKEDRYQPCPCGCTSVSNGTALRLAIANHDIPETIRLLEMGQKQVSRRPFFDSDTLEFAILHRKARELAEIPPLARGVGLLRPRAGSPRRHHAAWLYIASISPHSHTPSRLYRDKP
ncbi:hypothetical protein ACWEIJ_45125 [Lentzea sp. NPDC004789]